MARKSSSIEKSERVIDKESFRSKYNEVRPKYERLAVNLQQALKAFLEERNIPYLDVLFRVKDADSAYEKIGRKEIEGPFEQIEDWCGLRVICYYPSDVDNICKIIEEEFNILSQEDTAKRLGLKEFGYRSTHFILKVKESWMQPPNYRGLGELKAEIQVRTILMHAWAEVEHKLQYKNAEQVPEQFQRKLYLLSAKFEEADGQFEELRNGIAKYRDELRENISGIASFREQEFNLDTLQAFLDNVFADRTKNIEATKDAFNEFASLGLSMVDIIDIYERVNALMPDMEKIWRDGGKFKERLSRVGAIRMMIEVANEQYREHRGTLKGAHSWGDAVRFGIEKMEDVR